MSRDLERLAAAVRAASGIDVDPSRYPSLRAALARVAPGVQPGELVDRLGGPAGRELLELLLDEVGVKETAFLRDRRQLETIEWRRLLESARSAGRETVRVWSAGCATGDEAYTLALLACEAFAPVEPPVRILGTDLSRSALEVAAAGRYRPRSLREVEPKLRERYFRHANGQYEVDERLRALVELRRHNLVADAVPPLGTGPFDLILCRNVIIYFDAPTIERVMARLEQALTRGGVLLVGAADALAGPGASRRTHRPPERGRQRRSLPPPRHRPREQALAHALEAANRGRRQEAAVLVAELLADDPLDADTYFLRGLVELESGEPAQAVGSLRRALSIDPTFGLAAFTLGRAHDALRDVAAARRSYEQALRVLEPSDERHELLLQQVDLGDIAAACRARLGALR